MAKEEKIKKVDGKSKDIWEEKLERLKQEFPEAISENEIDCDQLKRLVGDENVSDKERYHFSWAGKSNVFKEIKKRTTKTLIPDREESVDFDNTNNIFIEGENLEVLKALQKSYYGKVKMIYIDPPYNTGNDFIYNDNYRRTMEEEREEGGELDEDGNLKSEFFKNTKTGHYHSNWLNMMYPRLYLARNLLKEDGVIFISIDDNEVHNLKMIMNEIFGEEKIDTMIWQKSGQGRYGKMKNVETFRKDHEYIITVFKEQESLNKLLAKPSFQGDYSNLDNDPRGKWLSGSISRKEGASDPEHKNYYTVISPTGEKVTRQFDVSKEKFRKLNKDNRIYWGKDGSNIPREKIFINEKRKVTPSSLLTNQGSTYKGKIEMRELFSLVEEKKDLMDNPKPSKLIKTLVQLGTSVGENSIVLDFFAGSATTAQAVMKQNIEDDGDRKYIMVQLPEETGEDSEARKAGYKNIAEIGRERIRRAAEKIKEENEKVEGLDLGFKAFKLSDSNFKTWQREEIEDKEELQQKLKNYIDNTKKAATKEDMLFELILKLGIDPTIKIEEKNDYYILGKDKYIICLEKKITKDLTEKFLEIEPQIVVCLDSGFDGDDGLKTNTALQMQSKNIEFKII